MRDLTNTTLAAQDISSELAVSVYTNALNYPVILRGLILLDGIEGNGDYTITARVNDATDNYDSESQTIAAKVGQTRLVVPYEIPLKNGHIASVLIEGKAADTSIGITVTRLADDAIVEADGSGGRRLKLQGADGDTLKTLSDQIDEVAGPDTDDIKNISVNQNG